MRSSLLTGVVVCFTGTFATGATYIESVDGDLSGNTAAPTPIAFTLGSNTVTGRMGASVSGTDADVFRFTVPAGRAIDAIDLTSFVPATSVGGGSFFAIAAGTSIDGGDASLHLSNRLVNSAGPLLPSLATPTFGGPGISGPLGPGTYTVWFQELATAVDYSFRFNVVPEPTSLALCSALPLLLRRKRR